MSRDPYANPRKTTTIRRLGPVDIGALRAAVLAIPEAVWDAENADKPNRFEALDRTRHIVFRFVDSTRDWRGSHDRPAWAQWRALLEPVLHAAAAPYGYADGRFPRVMLARMAPGGEIAASRRQRRGEVAAQGARAAADQRPGHLLCRSRGLPPARRARPRRSTTWACTRSGTPGTATAST